ncbi:MAG: AAA family ATPase [Actinophytocola sp.]|nr:AAA family ATPase [Actinophytocola sp.]
MAARIVGNLPAELTSFVGRRREMTKAKKLLSASRIVTLTGPGGVGKTRLALQVAEQAHRAFPDGVWLVEFAAVNNGELIAQNVAHVLGLRDESTEPLDRLTEYLRNKKLLLVADNCEHVVDPCAVLLGKVLAAAGEVRVLATSRHVLGIEGEQALSVSPLPVPGTVSPLVGDASGSFDAVTLFAERAAAVDPDFRITDKNRETVAAICQRLEGMPLALELAAVRLRAFSPEQVLARLDDALNLLSQGRRNAPERQQSLEAAIEWSYQLCSPTEQRLWEQLSVFSGGFTLEAIEAICSADAPDERMIDAVAGLVDKSIVQRRNGTHGRYARYHILEVVRQFGLARLAAAGQEKAARVRHRDYYWSLAARGITDYCSPRDVEWFRQARQEHANLRIALDFSLSEPAETPVAVEIATRLRPFWVHNGHLLEGYRWLTRALRADAAENTSRARALSACSFLGVLLSDVDSATCLLDECRALAEQLEATDVLAETVLQSAFLAFSESDLTRARSLAEEAAIGCRRTGNLGVAAESLAVASMCAFDLEDPRAGEIARDFLAMTEEQGAHLLKALALWFVGLDHWRNADHTAATTCMREAIELYAHFEQPVLIATCFDGLAWVAVSMAEHRHAATLMGAANTIWQASGMRLPWRMVRFVGEGIEHDVREHLGDRLFSDTHGRGAALPLNEAIDYALGKRSSSTPKRRSPFASGALTNRETEIARLVAKGLGNKQIATDLVISARTVETHVEHILVKLGFHSRTQIAAWVSEHDVRDAH